MGTPHSTDLPATTQVVNGSGPKPGDIFNPNRKTCGFYAPDVIGERPILNHGQNRLYERLVRRSGKKGYCWPSHELLAKNICSSRRQVIRDIAVLVKVGLITKQKRGDLGEGGRLSNIYRFRWHAAFDQFLLEKKIGLSANQGIVKCQPGYENIPQMSHELSKENCVKNNVSKDDLESLPQNRQTRDSASAVQFPVHEFAEWKSEIEAFTEDPASDNQIAMVMGIAVENNSSIKDIRILFGVLKLEGRHGSGKNRPRTGYGRWLEITLLDRLSRRRTDSDDIGFRQPRSKPVIDIGDSKELTAMKEFAYGNFGTDINGVTPGWGGGRNPW